MKEKNELIGMGEADTVELLGQMAGDEPFELSKRIRPFTTLLMQYRCAIREIETKLHVLNEEFSLEHERNPIELIESRVKEPASILEKMKRKGYELSVKQIEEKLNDVAGVRVICSFVEDIYYLASMLSAQDDLEVVKVKDYIKHPKKNGYRSLHLIIQIPIFLSSEKKYMRVEVQFRTIAMDFWASLDHLLKYKKEVINEAEIGEDLRQCAEIIAKTDQKMFEIRQKIEAQGVRVRK